jgi:succinoglycan biosynthesis protein ExoO
MRRSALAKRLSTATLNYCGHAVCPREGLLLPRGTFYQLPAATWVSKRCVSAILPMHNARQFVSRAIDSLLAQVGSFLGEIVVVDDCSSDGSADFVRERYSAEPQVRVFSTRRNSGPGVARNYAIAVAQGEWIAPIDADDAWLPDRLARLLPRCVAEVDVVFDNLIGYDYSAAAQTGPLFSDFPKTMSIALMALDQVSGSQLNFGYLKPLLRRSFLRRCGVTYPTIRISEDLLFYLKLLIHGARTSLVDEALYVYTTQVGKLSRRRSTISASVPDDNLVAHELNALVLKYDARLSVGDREAMLLRAQSLRNSASFSRVYYDWTRGRYLAALRQAIIDPLAWRYLFQKLSARFRRGTELLPPK